MNIEKGKRYYFNNREVIVLRLETPEMAFCISQQDITHEVTGSCFCTQCNVGGDYKGSHVCDETDEVIEALMEDISDKAVMWIPAVYLKEHPFEYRENEDLKADIKAHKSVIADLANEIGRTKNVLSNNNTLIELRKKEIESLEESKQKLTSENEDIEKYLNDSKNTKDRIVNVSGADINITSSELLKLYEAQIKLQMLEVGGVDNWEWYSEAIGDKDIKAEAINMLIVS